MGIVSWMYLHLRVDVHSGSRTQYRSLQTPPPNKMKRASWIPLLATINHSLFSFSFLRSP
ncbi:unnamed protein product [Schistosoma margrebowiei]|uniref:Uncharacterized protein n=1 Tax=Schistosoma margrebowiei TaxID=48269 RepID=A0A3P7YF20_9TREM|nr:unnamed protein product [Schistosoma margrebowiei]